MHRHRLLSLLCACFLLLAAGCKQQHPQGQAGPSLPPAKVRVATLAQQSASAPNEVSGSVEALERATIAAKVTGTIVDLPVVLGSQVKKGDRLARISAGEITARVSQAEAQLAQARRNYEREKRLLAKEASTPETVKSMQDALRVAQAGYDEARTMTGYTTIVAPFDGQVAMKMVNAGDLATAGTPLLVLENNRQLQVVAAVPEGLALKVRVGDKLPVRLPAAGLETTGEVREIAPAADAVSRTTMVKIKIEGGAEVRPGQFAKVLLPGARVETLMVPAAAVSRFGQMERVWVVQDGTARLRLVRTGERAGGQVEILAGLNPGDRMIVQGYERLSDGQPVQVLQ
ncbi:MAG: efflux RND transporter periplasmic adaptor subunit [Desulfobacteraceae bacterium]|nr:efflux RND transporter periplasmic adaptor subunit [Desulfobacteraceae bacterium]